MNKTLLVVLAIIFLGIGGYYLYQFRKPNTQSVTPSETPKNPPGVVNPEIEGANYKLYSKTEYEQALKDKKVVMLYFTANWCPICREQEPVNMEVLKSMESDDQIIAFRVHILDDETTKETEDLAKKFEVPYQHTTVIIGPGGKVFYKYTGPLTYDNLKNKLLDAKRG